MVDFCTVVFFSVFFSVFSCVLLYDLFAVLSSGTVCMFYLFTYIILSFCCKRRSRGVDARYVMV